MTDEEKKAYEFYRECNKNDLSSFEYFSEPSKEQIKYLETILNLIERLQKEYERLKEKHKITYELNVGLLENTKDCIPKQAIRDTIEELESYKRKEWDTYNAHLSGKIAILKELLGE